jgi:hypothetical protein
MILSFRKLVWAVFFSGTFILTWAGVSRSEVVVFDRVTTVQTAIRLIVLTKGFLFAEGGQLVDIFLDDSHLKKILTGGDGYGYLKYTPQDAGLKEIRARSDTGSATGLLLVMGKNEKAIIIDIESAFKDAVFSDEIREKSQQAVNSLSKNYKIIYLSRYVGKGVGRSWLKKENFPESVILRWQGPETFTALEERGVQVQAVIGSEDVMSAAKTQHIENRYTFEESTKGKTVKDWDEILKLLQTTPPAGEEEKGKEQKTEGGKCNCDKVEGEKIRR